MKIVVKAAIACAATLAALTIAGAGRNAGDTPGAAVPRARKPL